VKYNCVVMKREYACHRRVPYLRFLAKTKNYRFSLMMVIKLFFFTSLASLASSDSCTDLATSLGPAVASYTHGRVCHGLFWVVSGASLICHHSSDTQSWCPDRYPVYQTEAALIREGSFYLNPVLSDETMALEALTLSASSSTTPLVEISAATLTSPRTVGSRTGQDSDILPTMPPTHSSAPAAVYDACRMMHSRSYETDSGLCHGLFWLDDQRTSFCWHSELTATECPPVRGREVELAEAVEFIIELPRETTRAPPTQAVRPVRRTDSSLEEDPEIANNNDRQVEPSFSNFDESISIGSSIINSASAYFTQA